jgi:hypothetical protein
MSDTRPLPELSDYTSHLRHHWRRLAVFALLGIAIGTALFLSLPHRYVATSRVALSPQLTYLSLNTDAEKHTLVTLDTTAAMVRSDTAITKVADAMQVTPAEADDRLIISAKPGSRVLVLQVRGDTKEQAVAGSHAATESLLALQSQTFALNRDQVRLLKSRTSVLQSQAQQAVADGDPSQALFDTVEILQKRLDNAIATNNTDSAVIVRADVLQYRPGQAEVFVVGGFTLGLLIGVLSTVVHRRRP